MLTLDYTPKQNILFVKSWTMEFLLTNKDFEQLNSMKPNDLIFVNGKLYKPVLQNIMYPCLRDGESKLFKLEMLEAEQK